MFIVLGTFLGTSLVHLDGMHVAIGGLGLQRCVRGIHNGLLGRALDLVGRLLLHALHDELEVIDLLIFVEARDHLVL